MTQSKEMQGRVCVVTGASSGIGKVTALELARRGAKVVLVCRDRGRGEEVRTSIREAVGEGADVDLALADLSSQAEIRKLAQELLDRYPKIHVLVNNAGVINLKRQVTVDGIEQTFAVNHLAYFLLTRLLLDRLRESAPARIINVSSDAHRFGRLDFNDLQNERKYASMGVYGQSKLCNIHFTRELARRLAGSGVTVNCLHPGAVSTRFGQNNGRLAVIVTKLLRPFFLTAEQGADTTIYLASSPEVEATNGEYFVKRRAKKTSAAALDQEAAQRLWTISADLTGLPAALG